LQNFNQKIKSILKRISLKVSLPQPLIWSRITV
jgi:hypothetical protein